SATVACAARPPERCARPCWKRSKVSLIALLSEAHLLRQAEGSQGEQPAQPLTAAQAAADSAPQRPKVAPHRPRGLARPGSRGEAGGGCMEAERLRLDRELLLDQLGQLAQR